MSRTSRPLSAGSVRVWTFHLDPGKKFLEELASLPDIRHPHRMLEFIQIDSTSTFLHPLKLEEYIGRIRVHRWLIPLEGSDEDANYD